MFRAIDTRPTGLRPSLAGPRRDDPGRTPVEAVSAGSRASGGAAVHAAAVEPAIRHHDVAHDPAAIGTIGGAPSGLAEGPGAGLPPEPAGPSA